MQCDKRVALNVELFIRHGYCLAVQNTKWYVAMRDVPEPLLGRSTLEAFGINTKKLLKTVTGKMGSSIDMQAILSTQN